MTSTTKSGDRLDPETKVKSIDEIREGDLIRLNSSLTQRVDRVVEVKEDVIVFDKWDDGVQTKETEKDQMRKHINGETSYTPLFVERGEAQ